MNVVQGGADAVLQVDVQGPLARSRARRARPGGSAADVALVGPSGDYPFPTRHTRPHSAPAPRAPDPGPRNAGGSAGHPPREIIRRGRHTAVRAGSCLLLPFGERRRGRHHEVCSGRHTRRTCSPERGTALAPRFCAYTVRIFPSGPSPCTGVSPRRGRQPSVPNEVPAGGRLAVIGLRPGSSPGGRRA